jgi:hypothetical protein
MRSRSFGSVLILALLGAGALFAARASADMFHLAQDGLCNHSDKTYTFVLTIEDFGVTVSDRKGFHDDHSGTLAVGECASASFNISNDQVGCQASTVTLEVGTGRACTLQLMPDSALCGDGRGILFTHCSDGLRSSHGDEHFQIEIKN